jgi:hypothetical protein
MTEKISSNNLSIKDLPATEAEWLEISKFTLAYDPHESGEYFQSRGGLDDVSPNLSISELREILYLQQRYWNHYSEEPDLDSMRKIRDIISFIHAKLQKL